METTRTIRNILLGELPDGGKQFTGVLEEDIFGLPKGEPQSTEGLTYDLHVSRHDDFLLVTGSLKTAFSITCVRCLAEFPYRIELRGHTFDVEIPASSTVDLTETIREDMLLALPAYPKCENSSLGEYQCDPTVKIYSADDPPPEEDPDSPQGGAKQNVWGALDNLGSLNDND
ncbi:MAG: hypothetical protein ACI9R3_001142 [Verrucomicrobiales bacterium]|jgi:uncharacterized protein